MAEKETSFSLNLALTAVLIHKDGTEEYFEDATSIQSILNSLKDVALVQKHLEEERYFHLQEVSCSGDEVLLKCFVFSVLELEALKASTESGSLAKKLTEYACQCGLEVEIGLSPHESNTQLKFQIELKGQLYRQGLKQLKTLEGQKILTTAKQAKVKGSKGSVNEKDTKPVKSDTDVRGKELNDNVKSKRTHKHSTESDQESKREGPLNKEKLRSGKTESRLQVIPVQMEKDKEPSSRQDSSDSASTNLKTTVSSSGSEGNSDQHLSSENGAVNRQKNSESVPNSKDHTESESRTGQINQEQQEKQPEGQSGSESFDTRGKFTDTAHNEALNEMMPPIDLQGELTQTEAGEMFLHDLNDGDRILVLTTDNYVEMLCDSSVVYADGTFYSSPHLFDRLYCIHGEIQGQVFPLVYCLMPNRRKESYVRVLEHTKQHATGLGLHLNPDTFQKGHPNIFEIVRLLKREQSVTEVKIAQLNGPWPAPPRKRRYVTIDTRLRSLKDLLVNNRIADMQYTDHVAELLHLE